MEPEGKQTLKLSSQHYVAGRNTFNSQVWVDFVACLMKYNLELL